MKKIEATISSIKPLNEAAMKAAQARLDGLTKPPGSLAVLEAMARQFAGAVGNSLPKAPRKAIVLMAADHGVVAEGVSAFPPEVTEQMVYNFVGGGAGINVLARHADARLILVDVGVKSALAPNAPIRHCKIKPGTDNMRLGPAMTRSETIRAIDVGIDVVNELADEGINVVGLGEMGIGNTTASSAITSVLAGRPVSSVVGKGTGLSSECVNHKIQVIAEAIAHNHPNPKDAIDVLAKVGGLEIAGLAGVVLGAAARNMIVMLDGFISSAAVLAAYHMSVAVRPYLMASHLSEEPGHSTILEVLGIQPCLRLNMRLGEGTGAALGMTLLDASIKIINEMATFEEAQVASS